MCAALLSHLAKPRFHHGDGPPRFQNKDHWSLNMAKYYLVGHFRHIEDNCISAAKMCIFEFCSLEIAGNFSANEEKHTQSFPQNSPFLRRSFAPPCVHMHLHLWQMGLHCTQYCLLSTFSTSMPGMYHKYQIIELSPNIENTQFLFKVLNICVLLVLL